jgi:hypothetical protein
MRNGNNKMNRDNGRTKNERKRRRNEIKVGRKGKARNIKRGGTGMEECSDFVPLSSSYGQCTSGGYLGS